MQALTLCDAKITSTRTAVGQFKGHFKGAMEHFICGFDWHKNSLHPAKTKELGVSNSVGRWIKVQCCVHDEKLTLCFVSPPVMFSPTSPSSALPAAAT